MKTENEFYKQELRRLQIALVQLHRYLIAEGRRLLVIFEGRDAAGKDGVIKRIVEHLSPRETRVVALGKPSDSELTQWYFQRYCAHLPAGGEFVLFNRSWYNRAGVERVMGFCSDHEYQLFMESVVPFEQLLVASDIQVVKYYLDISRDEQQARLKARASDPLTQWKVSSVDEVALAHWSAYTDARDAMLTRTHHAQAPWVVVHTDHKHEAHIHLIRDLLQRIHCPAIQPEQFAPDRAIVFDYDPAHQHLLAH